MDRKTTEEITNFPDKASWDEALNKAPKDGWTQTRDLGGGRKSLYMPLTIQEALADVFFSEINTIGIDTKIVVNEIIVTVKLSVLPSYPNSEYITLMGISSKAIQMKSGGIAASFPKNKVTNALEYIAPAAKSSAISNAFSSYKNVFGKNLNRDVSSNYSLNSSKKKSKKKNK